MAVTPVCISMLSGECTRDRVTQVEFNDLMHIGCPVDDIFDVSVFRIARIMGYHFRFGEWGDVTRDVGVRDGVKRPFGLWLC